MILFLNLSLPFPSFSPLSPSFPQTPLSLFPYNVTTYLTTKYLGISKKVKKPVTEKPTVDKKDTTVSPLQPTVIPQNNRSQTDVNDVFFISLSPSVSHSLSISLSLAVSLSLSSSLCTSLIGCSIYQLYLHIL